MKLGLQMWSIHDVCMRLGVEKTMQTISQMGYRGFEFAVHQYETLEQLWGERPERVAEIMGSYGVEPVGIHLNWDLFSKNPMPAIEESKKLGLSYIGLGQLFYPDRVPHDVQRAIHARLKEVSQMVSDHGMKMVLHVSAASYCRDFLGRYSFEGMLEDVGLDLIQPEFDTAWMLVGGVDPEAYIRKYAGKLDILHMKEFTGPMENSDYIMVRHNAVTMDRGCAVGASGSQNVCGIIEEARKAGTKWIVTELWNEPDSIDHARESAQTILKYL